MAKTNKALDHKIDFTVVISVHSCNPNGDPQNDNRPRTMLLGTEERGLISNTCITRKIRNTMQAFGEKILFIPCNMNDGCDSVEARVAGIAKGMKEPTKEMLQKKLCADYIDLRTFGGLIFLKNTLKEAKNIPNCKVRGPVTIQESLSVHPIEIYEKQITKSENGLQSKKDEIGSDRMGYQYLIPYGCYVINGSINALLAAQTGFTTEDANKLKLYLQNLFVADASAARPEGSMVVENVIWWEHKSKLGDVPSHRLFKSVHVIPTVNTPTSIHHFDISVDTVLSNAGDPVSCENIQCG